MSRKKAIVLGFMGACPIAGVIWQHIHYIVGLKRLGYEVYYFEDTANWPYNPVTYEVSEDYTYAADLLARLAEQFDFKDHWAFVARFKNPIESAGLPFAQVSQLYREAEITLNICGSHDLNDELMETPCFVYVESDPGVEQIKIDLKDEETMAYLGKHHFLFTFGENIGKADFPVPTNGLTWYPTRQPVVTDFWYDSARPPEGAVMTSICNWSTSGLKDVEWRGERYLWSKSLEFLKFVEAPKLSGENFELAVNMKKPEERELFEKSGWRLSDPNAISVDWNLYNKYIRTSKGEYTVAKDQYVRLNTGWFSDRTACYLASGRPVITQETGFTKFYGGKKEGLFAFSSMEEIVESVREINKDYALHSRRAAELAKEHFEAEVVLKSMLEKINL
ncbi:MAG: hypothetical protein ABI615_06130 [Chthoniobacterales bacterium]